MHFVIVGGGSAGWMAAAALAQQLRGTQPVTLVESEAQRIELNCKATPPS